MKVRKPVFADRFYPGNLKDLVLLFDSIYIKEKDRINISLADKEIIGGIVPHAGYVYCGYEAIHFFEILKHSHQKYDTIVILNPSHSGHGHDVSVDSHDAWETPFGWVRIDKEFEKKLGLSESDVAQKYEHSGEVIVPYLQYWLDYKFKIVPICIQHQDVSNAIMLADKIFKAKRELNRNVLVLASSDFSHFVKPEYGKRMDNIVLDKIFKFDSWEMFETIYAKSVSVCGYCPIMVLMEYAKLVSDNPKTVVLKQGSSGDVMPSENVVDYISLLFYGE